MMLTDRSPLRGEEPEWKREIRRREEQKEKVCGTCRHHEREPIDGGWVCVCADSEHIADWTAYDVWCDCWEGRE